MRDPAVQLTAGFLHGGYDVGKGAVVGTYHFVTHPITTSKNALYGVASTIDRVIAAEDTPAIVQFRQAGTAISHAPAYDLGYATGSVVTNVALIAAPEALAGRAAVASRMASSRAGGSAEMAEEMALVPKGSANPATRAAAIRGSALHADRPGMLPDQLRTRYPNTQFEFTKSGVAGQDVRIVGGDHPSIDGSSSWPEGVNYGDFKPGTPEGIKTFKYDQKYKWSEPTHYLPYDPITGILLPH